MKQKFIKYSNHSKIIKEFLKFQSIQLLKAVQFLLQHYARYLLTERFRQNQLEGYIRSKFHLLIVKLTHY